MSNAAKIVQFVPLNSFVSPTFWHKLTEIKLDHDRLNDEPKVINGFYTNRNASSCLMDLDYTAFNADFKVPKFCYQVHGVLYNKNTIEEFKTIDKNVILKEEGKKLLQDFHNDNILKDPGRLIRFILLSFADLKSYNYYYWFAFPCPLMNTFELLNTSKIVASSTQLISFLNNSTTKTFLCGNGEKRPNFFILHINKNFEVHPEKEINLKKCCFTLNEFVQTEHPFNTNWSEYYFCFADNSEYEEPSWVMRLYATYLYWKCPYLLLEEVNFVGLRHDYDLNVKGSRIWCIKQTIPINLDNIDEVEFVGWELNSDHRAKPRVASMRESMDPKILAETSVNLNLKLMKWRLLPELNLPVIASTKCLLFGAGTLGCAVARMLIGWGFKHITFVDSGKVNYSNPIRQSLYKHTDASEGSVMKANVAAQRLWEINPAVVSEGYVVEIPMPGHSVSESVKQKTIMDLRCIEDLVKEHDALFLLTDTRESRWLPTVLGAHFDKIVINSALGFDSYLVQRHGSSNQMQSSTKEAEGLKNKSIRATTCTGCIKCIDGNSLGCYFCNDITAPGNSLKDRTLDQQCTVTRPGVSNIAASYAVELLVALLHHPLRHSAPAYYVSAANSPEAGSLSPRPSRRFSPTIPDSGILGILPHSIRGSMSNYENILPATQKFSQCIACSQIVLDEYRIQGLEFFFKTFESNKYLEDLTGLTKLKELDEKLSDFTDFNIE